MELVSIGELAVLLGVSVVTLRRWHQMGKLTPCCRTPGRHRRYSLSAVRQALGLHAERAKEQLTVCYARCPHTIKKITCTRKHSAWRGTAPSKPGTIP